MKIRGIIGIILLSCAILCRFDSIIITVLIMLLLVVGSILMLRDSVRR